MSFKPQKDDYKISNNDYVTFWETPSYRPSKKVIILAADNQSLI